MKIFYYVWLFSLTLVLTEIEAIKEEANKRSERQNIKAFTMFQYQYIIYLYNCGCPFVCVCQVMLHLKEKASCAKHSLGREAPFAPRMPSLLKTKAFGWY